MPKELTHWILAERALAALPMDSRLRPLVFAHHDAYLCGAVLPDTLLHLFRGPHSASALRLAHDFHDTDGNSFAPLIRLESASVGAVPDVVLACLLGVVTHMVADMIFHPFVYALGGTSDIGRHYRVETDIDLYLSHKLGAAPVQQLKQIVTDDTHELLIDLLGSLFDPAGELSRQALQESLALHCRIQAMYDVTHWKLVARLLGMLPGSAVRQQQHLFYPLCRSCIDPTCDEWATAPWRHPVTDAVMTCSVVEMAHETVQRITDLFGKIEACGSLTAALEDPPGANLLTGIHGMCKDQMRC